MIIKYSPWTKGVEHYQSWIEISNFALTEHVPHYDGEFMAWECSTVL